MDNLGIQQIHIRILEHDIRTPFNERVPRYYYVYVNGHTVFFNIDDKDVSDEGTVSIFDNSVVTNLLYPTNEELQYLEVLEGTVVRDIYIEALEELHEKLF